MNILGGKITTYHRLAESAIDKIKPYFDKSHALETTWTADAKLSGGEFSLAEKDKQIEDLAQDYIFIDKKESQRLINLYGTKARSFLGKSSSRSDLEKDFGKNLSAAEVEYLIKYEFARRAEDILWRRTKLGLYFSQQQTRILEKWINDNLTNILAKT